MLLEFDVQGVEKAISSFSDAFGVSISILYEDYTILGSKKLKNPYCRLVQSNKRGFMQCMDSNCALVKKCKASKKTEMHICHAGLVEIVTPILYEDSVIGYVSFGHIKMVESNKEISKIISDLPIDAAKAEEFYSALPAFEKEKIMGMIYMSEMFVKHITRQRLLCPKDSESFETVRRYVLDNYDKKITAQSIAYATHLSKTSLYNLIKKHTGNTVNDYINSIKMEKSKDLLIATDMTVEQIAKKLCFSGGTYYGVLFKKFTGMSPSMFRKTGLIELNSTVLRKGRK